VKALLSAAAIGVLFGLGVGVGGMADPAKVVGFLDVTGNWDPSLALVMAGALAVHVPLRRLILRRARPVLAASFPPIPSPRIDRRLLVGSALFGIGWGLAGYCPGPAVVSLSTGAPLALAFVASMVAGMGLFRVWERTATPSRSPTVQGAISGP